jgi:hypothetical protein
MSQLLRTSRPRQMGSVGCRWAGIRSGPTRADSTAIRCRRARVWPRSRASRSLALRPRPARFVSYRPTRPTRSWTSRPRLPGSRLAGPRPPGAARFVSPRAARFVSPRPATSPRAARFVSPGGPPGPGPPGPPGPPGRPGPGPPGAGPPTLGPGRITVGAGLLLEGACHVPWHAFQSQLGPQPGSQKSPGHQLMLGPGCASASVAAAKFTHPKPAAITAVAAIQLANLFMRIWIRGQAMWPPSRPLRSDEQCRRGRCC